MFNPRAATRAAVAVACVFLFALPVLALTEPTAPTVPPASKAPAPQSSSARPPARSSPGDDFVGLDYTPDQKAAIEKIHRQTLTRREAILRDTRLSQDQKDAMLFGYTRMEYVDIYKVLTPDQQSKVREKVRVRREAEKEAHKGQQAPPRGMPGR